MATVLDPRKPQALRYVNIQEEYDRITELHRNLVNFKGGSDEKVKIQEDIELGYNQLLDLAPDNPSILNAYGGYLYHTGRPGLALNLVNNSLQIAPQMAQAWLNLGIILNSKHSYARARVALQRAIQLEKNNADFYHVLAKNEVDDGCPEEAIPHLEYALMLNPDHSSCKFLMGLANLYLGNWEKGWEGYSLGPREKLRAYRSGDKEVPEWQGEKKAEGIIVFGEQGLGDEVLFGTCLKDLSRYLPETQVVLDLNPRLVPIFQRSFPHFRVESTDHTNGNLAYSGKLDYQLPLGSLPYFFRNKAKDFPLITPYLKPDLEKAKEYSKRYRKKFPMIGFAWLGGVPDTGSRFRSIPLPHFEKIFKTAPGATWLSLQYQPGIDEQLKPYMSEFDIVHDQELIDNIDYQISAIEACDLVVTVTMSVCDFAGGIGKECWTLVPSRPLWRFSHLGDTRAWYSTERLYRQTREEEDWNSCIDRLCKDLEAWLDG